MVTRRAGAAGFDRVGDLGNGLQLQLLDLAPEVGLGDREALTDDAPFLLFAALLVSEESWSNKNWHVAGVWIAPVLFFFGLVIEPLSWLGLPLWGAMFLSGIILLQLKHPTR